MNRLQRRVAAAIKRRKKPKSIPHPAKFKPKGYEAPRHAIVHCTSLEADIAHKGMSWMDESH